LGILGAVLLTLLRICQGLGVGGEWGGAVLLTVEWGSRGRRGLLGAIPQAGAPAGAALAYVVFQASTLALGPSSYWGWRMPFVISVLLVLVGLYIRLGVLETPVFAQILEERRVARLPVAEVVKHNWRDVVLTC